MKLTEFTVTLVKMKTYNLIIRNHKSPAVKYKLEFELPSSTRMCPNLISELFNLAVSRYSLKADDMTVCSLKSVRGKET